MDRMLRDYLRTRKALVDRALDEGLPRDGDAPEQIHAAMRYATLNGGKRIRPIIALAVGELGGCPPECVLRPACSVELVHTASLILDDLPCMDDAELRRGLPCTHIQYGEATSLLAVMGLVALAFEFAGNDGTTKILSEAMGTRGLVLGQHMDLVQTGCACNSMDIVEDVHRYKAGALFLASVQIPAGIAGLGPDQTAALESYARNIGFAFQITDDLMDARRGSEDAGKSTLVTLLGHSEAEVKARTLVDEAIEDLRCFGEKAEPLRALAAYVTARNE